MQEASIRARDWVWSRTIQLKMGVGGGGGGGGGGGWQLVLEGAKDRGVSWGGNRMGVRGD